jgi:hypothetical protein
VVVLAIVPDGVRPTGIVAKNVPEPLAAANLPVPPVIVKGPVSVPAKVGLVGQKVPRAVRNNWSPLAAVSVT